MAAADCTRNKFVHPPISYFSSRGCAIWEVATFDLISFRGWPSHVVSCERIMPSNTNGSHTAAVIAAATALVVVFLRHCFCVVFEVKVSNFLSSLRHSVTN